MKPIALGLLAVLALSLFVVEPLVGVTMTLAAFLGAQWVISLERRIRALEADAALSPADRTTAASSQADALAVAPQPRPAPAPVPTPAPAGGLLTAPPPLATEWAPKPLGRTVEGAGGWFARRSFAELEELLAGRVMAVVGGIALFLGGLFFLGLAFSRGWIGPELRVAIGLVAGVALFALGGWLLRGPRQIVAHVLVAVGIGVFTLAMFAATRLHGLVAPELGVAAALVAAGAAAAVAVRFDAPLVAGFGLVAVLASPPLMGASASLLTLAFVGTALAGTTAIAVFRSWRWLPPIAFVLSAPQLAAYVLDDAPIGIALGAIAGFWLLNAISAAGEELHRRTHRLSPSSATLLVLAAAFTIAIGFGVLEGSLERWRGVYLLAVAVAHLALASVFLLREGDRHPFGMLAAGSGIAAVSIAVPVQLGAPWVPLAWAAEAVALTWVAVERDHRYSRGAAAVLGALAAGHILAVQYPPDLLAEPAAGAVPFVNESGMALGFVLVACAVAIWLLRAALDRAAVAGVAFALVAVAVPHELVGWSEAAALTAAGSASIVAARRVLDVPLRLPPYGAASDVRAIAERAPYWAAAVAGLFLTTAFFEALPLATLTERLASTALPSARPFLDEPTAIAAIVVAGALAVAAICRGSWRPAGLLTAAAVTAYLAPIQVGAALAIPIWGALALALAAGSPRFGTPLAVGSRALAAATVAEVLLVVAPIERLWVRSAAADETAILNGAVLAAVSLAVAFGVRALLPPRDADARWAGPLAGAAALYAASIGLVDLFQAQVGGAIAREELEKQAQVALSVLWAVVGSVATVAGLRLRIATLRLAGLALLGVVTAKVFVVDLAALDIAYRVLSFVALGILLLAAAYLYARMQPQGPRGASAGGASERG